MERPDSTSHDKSASDYEGAIDALIESAAFLKSKGALDSHAYDYLSGKCTSRFTAYTQAMKTSEALAQNYENYELKVLSFINQLPEPMEVFRRSRKLAHIGRKTVFAFLLNLQQKCRGAIKEKD